MKKVKEYLEFRKNCRVAREEMINFATVVFPVVTELTKNYFDIVKFVLSLTEASKNVADDELLKFILSETAKLLGKSENRIMEIITYMANLSEEDIQKILVHSVVESKGQ